jgi:hypothetical protein
MTDSQQYQGKVLILISTQSPYLIYPRQGENHTHRSCVLAARGDVLTDSQADRISGVIDLYFLPGYASIPLFSVCLDLGLGALEDVS